MSENRVPLNRERLEAAIGQSSVYRTTGAYRSAVDDALFGLGGRYGPLIDLLIQLRKPQIMRDFKADDLSQLLSEALPPLSLRLIENVSISFRSLESDRQQLVDLAEVRKSVDTFLTSYSHYVRVAVRRRAADVRRAHSQFEAAQREIKRLSDESDKKESELIAAETEERQVEEALAAARQTERTLLASPEMKSAEDLRHAKETRDDRANRVEEAERTRLETHAQRNQRSKERKEAESFVARENELVSQRHAALTEAWQLTRLPTAGLPLRDAADTSARKVFDQTMANRARAIALLRDKNLELEKCGARRKEEETRFDQRRDDVRRCEEVELALRGHRGQALEELVAHICRWEASLEILPISKGEDWIGLFEVWLEALDTTSPLATRVELAHQSAMQQISDERSQSDRGLKEQAQARNDLIDELDTLRAGWQPEPPIPYTRDVEGRLDRPGAPLWKLCEFHDEVSAADRAGYEAALEAAGLLDAWVTPDGTLIDPNTNDLFLVGAEGASDGGLNRVLRVEGSLADAVMRVLASIGTRESEGGTWITSDGRWRHGLLQGAWKKPDADYLGHNAREEARLRRIAELEALLATVDESIARLGQERCDRGPGSPNCQ